jgi:FixJ family two-component response regulator
MPVSSRSAPTPAPVPDIPQDHEAVVYLVEDDPLVRETVARLVASEGLVVESFGTARDFLVRRRRDVPSCVILDFCLPGLSGLDVQRELSRTDAGIPIVFLSGRADISTSVAAMKAGAIEFLTKPVLAESLLDAVGRALEHHRSERLRRQELSNLRQRYALLTARQSQVMSLVVSGRLNKQIAGELGIGEITVKLHRARVMQKMEAGSVAHLARMAERLGLP